MGKNIVVFSDGTGQKGGVGSNTNVYKLFNMVEDRTERQITFYDPGLGTDWRKITGLINEAFAIYMIKNTAKRKEKANAFIEKHTNMWCKIKFLGVWDTVAALGLPVKGISAVMDLLFPHQFHSFDLSESVEFARHALSIDEERKSFLPVIWNDLENDRAGKMKQVWFAGVHTDVGGGYQEEDLSNFSLQWMIQEATAKDLLIYKKSKAWQNLLSAKPDINGMMHNEQKKFPGKWMAKKKRSWNRVTHGEPCIHASVFKRTKNSENTDTPQYSPWIFDCMNRENPNIEPWK